MADCHDESRFSILTQQNFGSNCFHASQKFVDQHRKIALSLFAYIRSVVFFPILCVYCLFSLLYFFTLSLWCCSLRLFSAFLFVFIFFFFYSTRRVRLYGIVVLCILPIHCKANSFVSIQLVDEMHIGVHKRVH